MPNDILTYDDKVRLAKHIATYYETLGVLSLQETEKYKYAICHMLGLIPNKDTKHNQIPINTPNVQRCYKIMTDESEPHLLRRLAAFVCLAHAANMVEEEQGPEQDADDFAPLDEDDE